MKTKLSIFDFAAEVGLTKHVGSLKSTVELLRSCHIEAGQYILDVGCGVGVTPCYLAKNYSCRVAGIDILPGMIERSNELAAREKVTELVEFRVGDARNIPYKDNLFDIVLTESVTSFMEDPHEAIREYVRVLKPGGYLGLNESTWFKPPSQEMIDWVSQEWGGGGNPLNSTEWEDLLRAAGLQNIVSTTHHIDMKQESKGILNRYGWGGMLRIIGRMLSMYLRNPQYRQFVKEVQSSGIVPKNIEEYFGFGLYVGKKP